MDINTLALDPEKVKDGVWKDVTIFPDADPVPMLIARAGNKNYEALKAQLNKPHLRSIRKDGSLPPELAQAIEVECVAKTILLDWKNVTDGENPLPYTPEIGIRFLGDDRFEHVLRAVKMESYDEAAYRAALLEESEKN